jgi:hypothetical protein
MLFVDNLWTTAGVALKVTFTPRYPKEAPQLEVRPLRNIDADSCASLQGQLEEEVLSSSLSSPCSTLLLRVVAYPLFLSTRPGNQALNNLEMAMILTLAQTAKVLPLLNIRQHEQNK